MAFPSFSLDGQVRQLEGEDASFPRFKNLSGLQYDAYVYSLNKSTTGCYSRGSLPIPLAANDTCLDGWYCPHSNKYNPPQYCAPSLECQIVLTNRMSCSPQGRFEPAICATGYYCPPGEGGKRQLACPSGTFCPSGSRTPFNCSWGAYCPEKSARQVVLVPLYVMLAIDVVLIVLVLLGLGITKRRWSKPKQYTTLDNVDAPADAPADNIELLRAPAMPGRSHSPSLSVTAPPEDLQYNTYATYSPYNPSSSGDSPPASTHKRRASGRADHMDGYVDDDYTSVYDDDAEDDDYHNSPDFQRFIRSMSRTIRTNSIGLSFDFEDIGFCTKKGKNILQGVTGSMPRGSCWGVMGGSGAGKSTFLNTLMGKQHTTSGQIKINGWQKDMSKYKKLIGYVPQDDIVFPELTVRENILHSARIRLPSSWRDKEIQDHVDSLIACLQLTHVQHSRVGDARQPAISGGQRKRVNIGIELAAAPMAIFLDEPTSGLDATSAATIMRLLRAISRLGVTTIAIIHQPREKIFFGFDQLLLLAQGRSVYSGPTEDVQTYFESLGFAFPQRANPADTLIDIITGDGAQYKAGSPKQDAEVSTIIRAWAARDEYDKHNKHLSTTDGSSLRSRRTSQQSLSSTVEQEESLKLTMRARGASWYAQVYYCWKRALTQQIRNSTSFFFEIGVGALAGGAIGLSAFGSQGQLFQGDYHPPFTLLSPAVDYASTPQLGLLAAMAIGLAASAPGFWVFGEEKLMYWRETAAGHSRSAYYVGKVLSTLLRIALSSLHYSVLLGMLATPLISFQNMFAANLLYFWCVYGLASVVSMVVKREDGPLIAVLCSLIIGVLGGVAPPLSKVKTWNMEWFWRLSPGVWFTEAYFTENTAPLGYLYVLKLASESVGFTLGQYGLDLLILFVLGCVYRVIAYLGLILIHRDKQR